MCKDQAIAKKVDDLVFCIKKIGWLCICQRANTEEAGDSGIKSNEKQFRLDSADLLDKVAAF